MQPCNNINEFMYFLDLITCDLKKIPVTPVMLASLLYRQLNAEVQHLHQKQHSGLFQLSLKSDYNKINDACII